MTVSHDLSRAQWRKSSHSSGNGQCVEVASTQIVTAVRDSVAPESGNLTFSTQAWTAFMAQAKAGHYDRP